MDIEQPAFVLHARPYRETSSIVTFFTPGYGKINGVVRGVRGGRKAAVQKAAAIQPFQQVSIQWREKPHNTSDLVSIKQIEMSTLRFPLMGDANVCGLYLNEILYRLLFPQVATENLFEHYQSSIYELLASKNRSEQAWTLRQFEYQLLSEMGQALICDYDIHQQKIEAHLDYFYYPQSGPVLASMDHQKMGVHIPGDCLLKMAEQQFCEDCLPALKRLFRTLLAEYLGGKPIRTRELFQA